MKSLQALFLVLAGVLVCNSIASAWTNPAGAPPNNNVAQPLNTGTTAQVKNGSLSLNTLQVVGASALDGGLTIANGALTSTIGNLLLRSGNIVLNTGNYINFANTGTGGSTGYGFRSNAGMVQYKNSGGAWTNITPSLTYAQYGYTNLQGATDSLCGDTTFAASMTSCEVLPTTAAAAVSGSGWAYNAGSTRIYKVIPGQTTTPWTYCSMNGYYTPYDHGTEVHVIRFTSDSKWYLVTMAYPSTNNALNSIASCYR